MKAFLITFFKKHCKLKITGFLQQERIFQTQDLTQICTSAWDIAMYCSYMCVCVLHLDLSQHLLQPAAQLFGVHGGC